jgi:hypothetical protein
MRFMHSPESVLSSFRQHRQRTILIWQFIFFMHSPGFAL